MKYNLWGANMKVRLSIVILLMLVTAACSAYRREFDTNPPFGSHFYRSFDVEVAWQTEQTGSNLLLSGTVANRRYAYLRDLELTAKVLDEKGNTLFKEVVDNFPTYIPPGKSASFRMQLKLPEGTIPARLHVNYIYFLREQTPVFRGDEGLDDTPHFGSFDAPL